MVECKLQSYHVDNLAVVLDDNKYLEELDLSWNNLAPRDMLKVTNTLGKNRTLRHLNLAWNFLTHAQKGM